MNVKLSILICSTLNRGNNFLPKILARLNTMYLMLSEEQQSEVEILVLTDNMKMMLGEKRNVMVDMAQGEYIVFVDDDDRLEDDYIKELLKGVKSGADVITFLVSVSLNGAKPKICKYSKDYDKDFNTNDGYFRLPNHICCVKKEVSKKSSFPSILVGEDSMYAKLLKEHLETEHFIDKVLYHYDYDINTTETRRKKLIQSRMVKRNNRNLVDVIFISNAMDEKKRAMTQKAIDTCISGANGLGINIIVLEQNFRANYKNAQTEHIRTPFNYNTYCNIGARKGKSKYIFLANNDLVFYDGWLHYLLEQKHPVVSPKCPFDKRQEDILENTKGYENARNFSGWAFMIERKVFDEIGGFDEDFGFWFADDSIIEQLKEINVEPMLVVDSKVHHLGSTTLKTLNKKQKEEYTWADVEKFNNKYNQKKFLNNANYKEWKRK